MAPEFTPRIMENYADVLIWAMQTARTEKFRSADIVLVRFDYPALELAEILYEKLIDRRMQVLVRMTPTARMEQSFFGKAVNRQLTFLPPGDATLMEALNGSIYLHAPQSLTHLEHVDPRKIGVAMAARKELRDILVRREEQGLFGWTLCSFPTPEPARQARLTERQYARQIIRACFLDHDDPPAQWKRVFREAGHIKRWLNAMDVRSFHVESAGIDLTITRGERRKWIGVSGHNIPSFELFLSPDWRGTRGVFFADQPSFRSGNYISGARLVFEKGIVKSASADEGEAFLEKQISVDPGAKRVGEFSLTDRRFSVIDTFMANTLFDENYGGRHGNCHIALGSSYSDTYDGDPAELTRERKKALGFNESSLHWDLVNREEKTVTARLASGKRVVIYEQGAFTL
ncbi:MAG: aminopeptidase [Syntrophales bacterium]|jgi:aminopeptidase|nr:aminopeptidase [Syntrophales bacterium]MCK9527533.1 aminopeptidase [Syntrophales bacterium]MDX9922590.1 aminopeptidase [Syntrophales bacterium]